MRQTHTVRKVIGLGIVVTLGLSHATLFSQPTTDARIADAASRAVVRLQASQAVWYEKQACASCHHQFQPAIAFAVARAHGVPLDETVAATDAAKAFDFSNLDATLQFANVLEPALQEGYRLIAAHAAQVKPNLATAISARFLIGRQRSTGDWSGLNQRPPSSSSDFAKTAIALRAIQLFRHPADAQTAKVAITRAAEWLATHQAPDTEGRSYQLLGLQWTSADRGLISRLGRELGRTQRPDGGWGSVEGRASEAYSTGEALVALHDAGVVTPADPIWQRGVAFLLRTQAADGSWQVPSRLHDPARLSPPYFESGYPYEHDQFISVAGAAWSIMALAKSLPNAGTVVPTTGLANAPTASEPWIETVVFGTAAELRRLLEHGLDPNAATAVGKTTALMMATSDPEKVRMLLDWGADVNARAASGFTALMVAAQYTNSDAAINLLLDRGARVDTVANGRPPLVHALAIAAHAGNAPILERLHRASGSATGTVSAVRPELSRPLPAGPTPMTLAVRNGDHEVARVLLDLGANVNGEKGDPWSPLESAVHNNRLDLARLFLERGANVNAVDTVGYTPLLLAASIDFGDTGMIDLLLKAGAHIDAKNPAGKTAIDLAREYQHSRFIGTLERAERADRAKHR